MNGGDGRDDVAFAYCSISSIKASMDGGNDKLLFFEVDVEQAQSHGGDGIDSLDRDEVRVGQGGSFKKTGWEYYDGYPLFATIQVFSQGISTLGR